MYTLYGVEAKEGDYVLIQDVAYMKGSAEIEVAQVHNGKAYAAGAVPSNGITYRWLRKETAIVVIPAEVITEEEKLLIRMNIDSDKSTFERGSEYFMRVWNLSYESQTSRALERQAKYGRC